MELLLAYKKEEVLTQEDYLSVTIIHDNGFVFIVDLAILMISVVYYLHSCKNYLFGKWESCQAA